MRKRKSRITNEPITSHLPANINVLKAARKAYQNACIEDRVNCLHYPMTVFSVGNKHAIQYAENLLNYLRGNAADALHE